MGEVRSEQFKLRGMYSAERLDPDKIAEQQKKVDELRRHGSAHGGAAQARRPSTARGGRRKRSSEIAGPKGRARTAR